MTSSDVNFDELQRLGENLNEFFAEIVDGEEKKEKFLRYTNSIWEFLEKDQCS